MNRAALNDSSALTWDSSAELASDTRRMQFINRTVEHLARSLPEKTEPLVLVSHGSGGLLMEHLLHQRLTQIGFSDLRWRCIDQDYDRRSQDQRETAEFSNNKNVQFYRFEADYLQAQAAHFETSKSDYDRGAHIVLSIAPPITIGSEEPPTGAYLISGRHLKNGAGANSIYLTCIPKGDASASNRFTSVMGEIRDTLEDGGSVDLMCSSSIECKSMGNELHIDPNCSPPSAAKLAVLCAMRLKLDELQPLVTSHRISQIGAVLIALRRIEKELAASVSLQTVVYNEPALAVSALRENAARSSTPAFFAELRRNLIDIKPLN